MVPKLISNDIFLIYHDFNDTIKPHDPLTCPPV